MGKRILLLGVYGMEVVECGGVLAKNVKNGGQSFASLMYKESPLCVEAANILGLSKIYFSNFQFGHIACNEESKLTLIKVIREVKPDIIITQDPDHIIADLDPDRRPAMTLILESIALASRDYALDKTPGLEPHPIPHIYYMSPVNPNCTVNIADVWDLKDKGMGALGSQLEFSAKHFEGCMSPQTLEAMVPGYHEIPTLQERGRALHRAMDKSLHMYHGCCGHGNFALAEAYRYEGMFEFNGLI
jgi:hypothetical protein